MRTAEEVMAWIEANDPDKDDKRTPQEKAAWWVAYRTAERMREDMTTKDLAEFLLGLHPPIGSIKSIQSYIDDLHGGPDATPTEIADTEAEMEQDLRQFWGVK